jgi:hypothetical protein
MIWKGSGAGLWFFGATGAYGWKRKRCLEAITGNNFFQIRLGNSLASLRQS